LAGGYSVVHFHFVFVGWKCCSCLHWKQCYI